MTETSQTPEQLILYHSSLCGFCWQVKSVIDDLGVDVEMRDTLMSSQNRKDLMEARGRGTVPVLRRIQSDGSESWMPESKDIIQYLKANYAG